MRRCTPCGLTLFNAEVGSGAGSVLSELPPSHVSFPESALGQYEGFKSFGKLKCWNSSPFAFTSGSSVFCL